MAGIGAFIGSGIFELTGEAAAGIWILRIKQPEAPRKFRAPDSFPSDRYVFGVLPFFFGQVVEK